MRVEFLCTHTCKHDSSSCLCAWDIALQSRLNWEDLGLLYQTIMNVDSKYVDMQCVIQ